MASSGEGSANLNPAAGPPLETEDPLQAAPPANNAAPSAAYECQDSEKQLAQLHTANEELQRRLASTEKDRDLFRELYGKASAHASDVSNANNELAERAALAEGRARDGVAMVKATYEWRVHRLEKEVERLKEWCHSLIERDRRTNDGIRRRAALEPELREQNAVLREQVQELEVQRCQLSDTTLLQLEEDSDHEDANDCQ